MRPTTLLPLLLALPLACKTAAPDASAAKFGGGVPSGGEAPGYTYDFATGALSPAQIPLPALQAWSDVIASQGHLAAVNHFVVTNRIRALSLYYYGTYSSGARAGQACELRLVCYNGGDGCYYLANANPKDEYQPYFHSPWTGHFTLGYNPDGSLLEAAWHPFGGEPGPWSASVELDQTAQTVRFEARKHHSVFPDEVARYRMIFRQGTAIPGGFASESEHCGSLAAGKLTLPFDAIPAP